MPFEITADNHEISNNKPVNDSKSADETRILNGRITTPKAKEEEQYLRELQDRHGTFSHASFYNYWMYFHFCFCFFRWYFNTNYELCNRIKIFCNNSRIKKYNSIIKKKKTKHHKTVSLAKSKRHNIEVLIFKDLIDSVISDDEFVSTIIILKEFDNIKEKRKHVLCNKKIVNISKRVY